MRIFTVLIYYCTLLIFIIFDIFGQFRIGSSRGCEKDSENEAKSLLFLIMQLVSGYKLSVFAVLSTDLTAAVISGYF